MESHPNRNEDDNAAEITSGDAMLSATNRNGDNPLVSLDPQLIIRIYSFLDMLSVTRIGCASSGLSGILQKEIQLQSFASRNHRLLDHDLEIQPKVSVFNISPMSSLHIEIEPLLAQNTFKRTRFPYSASLNTHFRIPINLIIICSSNQMTMSLSHFEI